ncbi:MAG: P-loop NTPase [Thermoplasmata archaeon]
MENVCKTSIPECKDTQTDLQTKIIENMDCIFCLPCAGKIDLFKASDGERTAKELRGPYPGWVPIDLKSVEARDSGSPL